MARTARLLSVLAVATALVAASPAGAATDPERFTEVTGGVSQGPALWVSNWGGAGSSPEQLQNPLGIAANADSELFIADAGNDRIVRTYPSGDRQLGWGSAGTAPGRFDDPCGVAVTPSGDVLVVDRGNDRVQRFTQRGRFLSQWGLTGSGPGRLDAPCGVAVAPNGQVYVADTGNDRIEVFDATGAYVTAWGTTGSALGRFRDPLGVAVGRGGNVYVADTGNDRIQVLTATGQPITSWQQVAPSAGLGRLEDPAGIAVDQAGRVYVTDTGSDRVQRYTVDGAPLAGWGTSGSGVDGQMDQPFGIVVSPRGAVVITDRANSRIEVWGWARPDATIRLGLDGKPAGEDVYNTTGRRQLVRVRSTGEAVELQVAIEQDGAYRPLLQLRGGASTRQFDIRYLRRGRDVTAQVVAGTFRTSYRPGTFRLRIVVTPHADAEPGAVADRVLRAAATSAPGVDVVRFQVVAA